MTSRRGERNVTRERNDLRSPFSRHIFLFLLLLSLSCLRKESARRVNGFRYDFVNFLAEFSRLVIFVRKHPRPPRIKYFSRRAWRHDIATRMRERKRERDDDDDDDGTRRARLCSRPLSALLSRSLLLLVLLPLLAPPTRCSVDRSISLPLLSSLVCTHAHRLSFSPSRTAYRKTSGSDVNQA